MKIETREMLRNPLGTALFLYLYEFMRHKMLNCPGGYYVRHKALVNVKKIVLA